MAVVEHLHRTPVAVTRDDGAVMRFVTYRFGPGQWGYELLRANGEPASLQSDPDWLSEEDVIAAIREHGPLLERDRIYGWVLPTPAPAAGPR